MVLHQCNVCCFPRHRSLERPLTLSNIRPQTHIRLVSDHVYSHKHLSPVGHVLRTLQNSLKDSGTLLPPQTYSGEPRLLFQSEIHFQYCSHLCSTHGGEISNVAVVTRTQDPHQDTWGTTFAHTQTLISTHSHRLCAQNMAG